MNKKNIAREGRMEGGWQLAKSTDGKWFSDSRDINLTPAENKSRPAIFFPFPSFFHVSSSSPLLSST